MRIVHPRIRELFVRRNAFQVLAQAAFWGALVAAFLFAVLPANDTPRLVPWDKALHFIAFYALAILAGVAFPRSRLVLIALGLSAFGWAIEVVQGLPFVHRDKDVLDWAADSLAILCALGPAVLPQLRAWTSRRDNSSPAPSAEGFGMNVFPLRPNPVPAPVEAIRARPIKTAPGRVDR